MIGTFSQLKDAVGIMRAFVTVGLLLPEAATGESAAELFRGALVMCFHRQQICMNSIRASAPRKLVSLVRAGFELPPLMSSVKKQIEADLSMASVRELTRAHTMETGHVCPACQEACTCTCTRDRPCPGHAMRVQVRDMIQGVEQWWELCTAQHDKLKSKYPSNPNPNPYPNPNTTSSRVSSHGWAHPEALGIASRPCICAGPASLSLAPDLAQSLRSACSLTWHRRVPSLTPAMAPPTLVQRSSVRFYTSSSVPRSAAAHPTGVRAAAPTARCRRRTLGVGIHRATPGAIARGPTLRSLSCDWCAPPVPMPMPLRARNCPCPCPCHRAHATGSATGRGPSLATIGHLGSLRPSSIPGVRPRRQDFGRDSRRSSSSDSVVSLDSNESYEHFFTQRRHSEEELHSLQEEPPCLVQSLGSRPRDGDPRSSDAQQPGGAGASPTEGFPPAAGGVGDWGGASDGPPATSGGEATSAPAGPARMATGTATMPPLDGRRSPNASEQAQHAAQLDDLGGDLGGEATANAPSINQPADDPAQSAELLRAVASLLVHGPSLSASSMSASEVRAKLGALDHAAMKATLMSLLTESCGSRAASRQSISGSISGRSTPFGDAGTNARQQGEERHELAEGGAAAEGGALQGGNDACAETRWHRGDRGDRSPGRSAKRLGRRRGHRSPSSHRSPPKKSDCHTVSVGGTPAPPSYSSSPPQSTFTPPSLDRAPSTAQSTASSTSPRSTSLRLLHASPRDDAPADTPQLPEDGVAMVLPDAVGGAPPHASLPSPSTARRRQPTSLLHATPVLMHWGERYKRGGASCADPPLHFTQTGSQLLAPDGELGQGSTSSHDLRAEGAVGAPVAGGAAGGLGGCAPGSAAGSAAGGAAIGAGAGSAAGWGSRLSNVPGPQPPERLQANLGPIRRSASCSAVPAAGSSSLAGLGGQGGGVGAARVDVSSLAGLGGQGGGMGAARVAVSSLAGLGGQGGGMGAARVAEAAAGQRGSSSRADVHRPSDWVIGLHEVSFQGKIGAGAAGTTYLAQWNGARVAVKVAGIGTGSMDSWRAEVDALTKLRHPNIVQYLGCVMSPPTYCLVLEFCDAGDLYRALRLPAGTPPGLLVRVAHAVAAGMAYLHRRKIMHRDLKSSNVLLNTAGGVKLTDFGVAVQMDGGGDEGNGEGFGSLGDYDRSCDPLTTETGTYRWMAPEVARHGIHTAGPQTHTRPTLASPLSPFPSPLSPPSSPLSIVHLSHRPRLCHARAIQRATPALQMSSRMRCSSLSS